MLTKITFPYDFDHFYLGKKLVSNPQWSIFVTTDDSGYYTNIHLFKTSAIKEAKDSPESEFYNFQKQNNNLLDPFDLKKKANKLTNLKWTTLAELLSQIKTINPIISLTSQNDVTYTGQIMSVNDTHIVLKEIDENYQLNEFPLLVDLNEISAISFNSVEHNILNAWLTAENNKSNQDLVEVHLDYQDDDRFESFYIGKIIKQNDNYLLLAALNDLGQLDGIYLIDKKHVVHLTTVSQQLDYFQFAMNYHLQNNTFNLRDLKTDFELNAFTEYLKSNQLTAIDNVKFDQPNIGLVKEIKDNTISFQNIEDYTVASTSQMILLDDIGSIELTSNYQQLLAAYLQK